MMLGFEEYYNDLLMEAKSPEEIKKILNYKYVQGKHIPENIVNYIFSIDPTKKKTYTSWLLNCWDNEKDLILSLGKQDKIKELFKYFQERNNTGLSLTQMKTLKEAYNMLPNVDDILSKSGNGPENNFEIVYDTPEWKIAVPHSYEAAIKLGKGCKWCTADYFGNGLTHYNNYSSYGPLWVNFDCRQSEIGPADNKEYPYTRYQFLFEYRNGYGEFMDSEDRRIDFDDLEMPEAVIDFYGEQDESYKETIENGPTEEKDENAQWEEYDQMRYEDREVLRSSIEYECELCLAEPINRDTPTLGMFDYLQIYSEDFSDPIMNSHFDSECVIENFNGGPCILLKDKDEQRFMFYYAGVNGWEYTEMDEPSYFYQPRNNFICFWIESWYHTLYFTNDRGDNILYSQKLKKKISNVIYMPLENDGYNGLYGFSLEIVFDDGFHALLEIQEEDCAVIVENDKPLGEHFVVTVNENGDYVQGMYGKHFLDGDYGEELDRSYDFEGEVNDNVYIVASRFGWSAIKYNLYNKQLGKLILDRWYTEISKLKTDKNSNLVILKDSDLKNGNFAYLYNVDTQTSTRFTNIVFGINYFAGKNNNSNPDVIFTNEGEPIKTFENIEELSTRNNKDLFIISGNKGYNAYNPNTGKFLFPEGVTKYQFLSDNSDYLAYLYNNDYYIYNFLTEKVVEYGIDKLWDKAKTLGGNAMLFRKNNKFNILLNDELLLPQYVDEIYSGFPVKGYLIFFNEDKGYCVDINTGEIKPRNGFNTQYINKDCTTNVGGSYYGLMLRDPSTHENIKTFYYDPATNNIVADALDNETKQLIYKNIFNDSAMIAENFNKILNRINNVKH